MEEMSIKDMFLRAPEDTGFSFASKDAIEDFVNMIKKYVDKAVEKKFEQILGEYDGK